jgi:hypothetical protein
MRVDLGLWKGKGEQWHLRQDEFPGDDQRVALRRVVDEPTSDRKRDAGKRRKAEKRHRKAQDAAKRRNRKKK